MAFVLLHCSMKAAHRRVFTRTESRPFLRRERGRGPEFATSSGFRFGAMHPNSPQFCRYRGALARAKGAKIFTFIFERIFSLLLKIMKIYLHFLQPFQIRPTSHAQFKDHILARRRRRGARAGQVVSESVEGASQGRRLRAGQHLSRRHHDHRRIVGGSRDLAGDRQPLCACARFRRLCAVPQRAGG